MRGQFYLIAGLAFILLFFVFIPRQTVVVESPASDLPYLAANLQRELPHALVLGENQSSGVPVLVNFTRFAQRVLEERAVEFRPVWVVAQNASGDLNVTVGNFLGANETVTVNVSGSAVGVQVASNGTNSTVFSAPPEAFVASVAFRDQNESMRWQRDKVSFYGFVNLTRFGQNLQVNVSG